ncbi:MAG: YqgE/AlgH family protein [Alphaproteobacteria bacterium]
MTASEQTTGYLEGQLLIAMPAMQDPRFARTVIFICAHNSDGAMGLVVNKLFGSLTFSELLEQVGIEATGVKNQIRVHFGGPVESGRGFVLHSPDYVKEGTLVVESDIALTASVDILKAIAEGQGPRHSFLALGYAGWGPGQLDSEIQANGWLHVPADPSLVFDDDLDTKWKRAMAKLGVDFGKLSGDAGHA